MALPSFAPFPPVIVRSEILPEEWTASLEAWLLLSKSHLLLPASIFSLKSAKDDSLFVFLLSYMRECSESPQLLRATEKEKDLRRQVFLLTHRFFTEIESIPSMLLRWDFLGDLCIVYNCSANIKGIMGSAWLRMMQRQTPNVEDHKKKLTKCLEKISAITTPEVEQYLRRTAAVLWCSHDYGQSLMIGSDVLDSLMTAWNNASADYRKKIVTITYLSLFSLLEGNKPNSSLLIDHLYSLKSNTEATRVTGKPDTSLLVDLASRTPFVNGLRVKMKGSNASRARSLITYLEGLKASGGAKPKIQQRRRIEMGKNKEKDEYGHGSLKEVHVHKLSLISQIQDLFPDLGTGFIVKLLDEYDNDTEQVTAILLDDSLPPHLRDLDRSEKILVDHNLPDLGLARNLEPRTKVPQISSRRNVFDNDDFSKLSVSPSSLHVGRKNPNLTADQLLADRSTAPHKAAILAALAVFDADDDERDDTYDVEDVGGTVDSAIPGSDEIDADLGDKNEEALFTAYRMSPGAFERDANTRKGKPRTALKSETGMTDEVIEGWAIMIGRDPRRLRRLEAKFSTYSGGQTELAPTAYREGLVESGTEDSDGGRGGFRGRGRGRGWLRGCRGGIVAGPADNKLTQVARQRKDAQKGSRANHNRRDQRARKMARGGFPG
ncbi:hypothetical protein MMC06_004090 [Schaereria dolodes]|nr:hypothetical protein [Schaereria dolodes]